MKGSRRSGYAIAVFAGLTIASCEACEKEDQPPVGTGVKGGVMLAGTLSTAQCQGHGNVVVQGPDPGNPVVYDTLPLVGTITNVPEFNDCQRFIGGSHQHRW